MFSSYRKTRKKKACCNDFFVVFVFLLSMAFLSVVCYFKTVSFIQSKTRYYQLDKPPLTKDEILKQYDFIQSHTFHLVIHYILHPKPLCENFDLDSAPSRVLICVKSLPGNFHLREWVRWNIKSNREFSGNFTLVFLIGQPLNSSTNELIGEESNFYGDLVQGNFTDTAFNTTYKTIMGFQWAIKNCHQAQHIVFLDERFKINLTSTLTFLRNESTPKSLYMGHLVKREKTNRVKENIRYIPKEEYPLSYLPPFVSGNAFIISMDVAKTLAFHVNSVKMVHLDEVFLGLVAMFSDVIFMHSDLVTLENCGSFKGKLACNMFLSVDDALHAWMEFTNSNVRI